MLIFGHCLILRPLHRSGALCRGAVSGRKWDTSCLLVGLLRWMVGFPQFLAPAWRSRPCGSWGNCWPAFTAPARTVQTLTSAGSLLEQFGRFSCTNACTRSNFGEALAQKVGESLLALSLLLQRSSGERWGEDDPYLRFERSLEHGLICESGIRWRQGFDISCGVPRSP